MLRRVTNPGGTATAAAVEYGPEDDPERAAAAPEDTFQALESRLQRLVRCHGAAKIRRWPLRDLAAEVGCRLRTMQALRRLVLAQAERRDVGPPSSRAEQSRNDNAAPSHARRSG